MTLAINIIFQRTKNLKTLARFQTQRKQPSETLYNVYDFISYSYCIFIVLIVYAILHLPLPK